MENILVYCYIFLSFVVGWKSTNVNTCIYIIGAECELLSYQAVARLKFKKSKAAINHKPV